MEIITILVKRAIGSNLLFALMALKLLKRIKNEIQKDKIKNGKNYDSSFNMDKI